MSLKKMPMDSTEADALKAPAMPAPEPGWLAGRLFMIPVWFGRDEGPHPDRVEEDQLAKPA